jgi:hypothetical protein
VTRGNCLLALLVLRLRGVTGRVVVAPSTGKRGCPHLLLEGDDGYTYHFRRKRDLLPWCLRVLWFEGELVAKRHRPR